MALTDLIKAHANYKRGLTELEGQLGEIQAAADILEAKHGVLDDQISVLDSTNTQISNFEDEIWSDKRIQVHHLAGDNGPAGQFRRIQSFVRFRLPDGD